MSKNYIDSIEELHFGENVLEFIDGVEVLYNIVVDKEMRENKFLGEKVPMLDWINNNIGNIDIEYKNELTKREIFLQCVTFLSEDLLQRQFNM